MDGWMEGWMHLKNTHKQVCIYIYKHIYVYVYVCIYIYHVYADVIMHAFMYVCMHVCHHLFVYKSPALRNTNTTTPKFRRFAASSAGDSRTTRLVHALRRSSALSRSHVWEGLDILRIEVKC